MKFHDPRGYYLDNEVLLDIPYNSSNLVDVGPIMLLTPDGNGCKGALNVD